MTRQNLTGNTETGGSAISQRIEAKTFSGVAALALTHRALAIIVNQVVNYSGRLDSAFSALADPTRRAILTRLAQGEATVKELAKPFKISLPAISRHLRVLEAAGLLERRKQGRVHHCRLAPHPLQDAAEWLAFYQRFWDSKLDVLAGYLATSDETSGD